MHHVRPAAVSGDVPFQLGSHVHRRGVPAAGLCRAGLPCVRLCRDADRRDGKAAGRGGLYPPAKVQKPPDRDGQRLLLAGRDGIFMFYTFGPYGNAQAKYSWFIWAIAGILYGAVMAVLRLIGQSGKK